jgi:hypothetical protein
VEEKALKKIVEFIDKWEEKENYKKIDEFHEERLKSLKENKTPITFAEGMKVVLHLIPMQSITLSLQLDLYKHIKEFNSIKTLRDMGHEETYNFDGFLRYHMAGENKSYTYVQLFSNGTIEAVGNYIRNKGVKVIPIFKIEENIASAMVNYLECQKNLKIKLPIVFYLDLLQVKGLMIKKNYDEDFDRVPSIDKDDLNLPKIVITDYKTAPKEILRSNFNRIWNSAGYSRSFRP